MTRGATLFRGERVTDVLYISSVLPALSETFVYRELFALRARGLQVEAASVRPPEAAFGPATLQELTRSVIRVYGTGSALLGDAVREFLRHPLRAGATLTLAKWDALTARRLPLVRRAKVMIQAVAALALAHRVRGLGVRHIHAHFAHVPATIAMYAARQLGVTFSMTGHANDLFQQQTLLAPKLRRAAFTACISHWHRDYYRQLAPDLPDERLPIVRCGVDVPAEPAAKPAGGPPTIVAVGRLVAKKGFQTLVAALGRLQATGVDFRATIVGDGPERAALTRQIAELHLAERVTLAGAQPHADILMQLRAADLFALPCQPDAAGDRDGIPVALMEALAAGVPVVSGDLPAIRELVCDNDTGRIVPPGDVDALTTALATLLQDATLRRRLGDAGRAWVAEEFSTPVNTTRLLQAFDTCLHVGGTCCAAVRSPSGVNVCKETH